MEQKLKQLIGDLHFMIASLQQQNEDLQTKLKGLEVTNG